MKNNLIIIIISFFCFNNLSLAESFKFETKNLEIIKEGKQIKAKSGKAISSDKDLEIIADEFDYTKDLDILKTNGNGFAYIKSKNLEIRFDEAIFNQKNSTIQANGNVKINQVNENFNIQTNNIFYEKEKNIINSDTETVIKDINQNIYIVDDFIFEINKDILKVTNLRFKDKYNNNLVTPLAYINTKSGKLFGKDVNVNLNNSSFGNKNEPRLKGRSFINNKNSVEVKKGVFTTCKKRDGCPPWQMSAEEINHDKKKQTINYKNAFLRVYDIPVMYFPKFFHPDPTVKRRSGFLIPTIKNSPSSDNYLNTPYFLAISENRDATFSPRLYVDEKILLQTEYREVNKNSKHFADFSFFTEKNLDSKNHFFYEFDKSLDLENFEDSEIKLEIQKTFNDTYLKTKKLKSKLIKDNNILQNSFGLNLFSNNLSVNMNTIVYEDLDKHSSDRYEYILPKIDLVKQIDNKTNLNGDFSLKSEGLVRNYNTNVYEKTIINDLIFNSYPKINKMGFYNDYQFLIKNYNSDNQNSDYKNGENVYVSGLFQYNSSLPLIKENQSFQKILKPRFSLKMAPTHTKDNRNGDTQIDVNNIYSMNRTTGNESVEGGTSIAYGSDYSIFDKGKSREVLGLKLANNIRFEVNDDLPKNNQIGQKTSDFFTEILYSPNEILTTTYNTSIKNNLSDINYENLVAEIKINNLVTTFDYLNENNTTDKNSYLTNTTRYSLNNSNSLSFSTRENKTADLTEYYNLMYQYKNDCLSASIDYNKEYYSDRDLKPEESIFFKLTIIPFGQTSSPNLKN